MSKEASKRFFKRIHPGVTVLKPKRIEIPSISRLFPAIHPLSLAYHPTFLAAFLGGFLLVCIGIVGVQLRQNLSTLSSTRQERLGVELQIKHWEGITKEYTNYRDGHYQLALLNYQLGNKNAASLYIKKVLAIDPNFREAKEFAEKLMR